MVGKICPLLSQSFTTHGGAKVDIVPAECTERCIASSHCPLRNKKRVRYFYPFGLKFLPIKFTIEDK